MAPRGQKQPGRSNPGQWVGGECAQPGSIWLRLDRAEQRRLKDWLNGRTQESEDYIRSLVDR